MRFITYKGRRVLVKYSAIRNSRMYLGLSQQELAKILHMPLEELQRIEDGTKQTPEYVERLILDALFRMTLSKQQKEVKDRPFNRKELQARLVAAFQPFLIKETDEYDVIENYLDIFCDD